MIVMVFILFKTLQNSANSIKKFVKDNFLIKYPCVLLCNVSHKTLSIHDSKEKFVLTLKSSFLGIQKKTPRFALKIMEEK